MAKVDLSKLSLEEKLELLKTLEPAIKNDRAKQLEPTKKHIADTYKTLLAKVEEVKSVEPDYVAPWDWETMRFDSQIKLHLQRHGEQTAAQIAAALGKPEAEVSEVLKARSKGDRILFLAKGDKFTAAKPAKSEN